jgi:opacity protein-like surface antigen
MKKNLLLAVIVVALVSSAALALDPMGPPAAGLKKGQWSAGVDYSYSNMDLKQFLTSWSNNTNETLEINKMHKIYANIGYGICHRVGSSSTYNNYVMKTTNSGRTWSDSISIEPVGHAEAKPQAARPGQCLKPAHKLE